MTLMRMKQRCFYGLNVAAAFQLKGVKSFCGTQHQQPPYETWTSLHMPIWKDKSLLVLFCETWVSEVGTECNRRAIN